MNRTCRRLSILGFIAASCCGCISSRTVTPPVALNGTAIYAGLEPKHYDVIGDAAGSKGGGSVFFIPYGDDACDPAIVDGKVFLEGEMMAAVVDALEKAPGANAVLEPRIQESSTDMLFWSSWSVTVFGKAIKVHQDRLEAPK
jgi:hypothetical protein